MGWLRRLLALDSGKRGVTPAERWNRFIDDYGMRELYEVDADHRRPFLFYRYFSEVYNGGHLQFFLNQHALPMDATSEAIADVLGKEAADNFDAALATWRSWDQQPPETAGQYVDLASRENLDAYDSFIYRMEPSMEEHLENYMIERNLI